MIFDPLEELRELLKSSPSGKARTRVFPPDLKGDAGQLRPPVDARANHLPLAEQDGFSWTQFESFCADLLELLFDTSRVYRFGGAGSAQQGIDIVVELKAGGRLGAQCKQRKQFGPGECKAAIGEASFDADLYLILLSRVATAAARKVVDDDPRWQLLDIDDISRLVRGLPPEDARRLVENHFGPRWRQRFLGSTGPDLFVSCETAFAGFEDRDRIFRHDWQLVGREEELGSLKRFRDLKDSAVAILVGVGGIGKSKLLNAFAAETESPTVVFVSTNVPATPEGLDELTLEPVIVVIDDAHRREDLDQILGFLYERQHRSSQVVKALISTRPRRLDELDSTLGRCGFDPAEVVRLENLVPLSARETEKLAEEALGPEHRRHAPALSGASGDCPLITVVGAQLIRREQVAISLLGNHEQFRYEVLGRFRDELIGDFSGQVPTEDARELLSAIAAVGPFPVDDAAALTALSDFTDIKGNRVGRYLGRLEGSGVLSCRGRQLRISPDLLADFILEEACLNDVGPTGYAKEAYRHFETVLPGHVLRNLAELDWRMRAADRDVDLLGDAWEPIKREVLAANNRERGVLLGRLESIAYFQPKQVLEIVEEVLADPRDVDGLEFLGMRLYAHAEVVEKVPAILRAIAFNARYVDRAVALLWELGRDDARQTNRVSDHPMRVLGDLASYSPTKPVGFNDLVRDAVEHLLGEPGVHGHEHLLLGVVGKFLAREGTDTWARDRREFVMSQFLIDPKATSELRVKAIAILRREALGENLRAACAATKQIGDALRGPFGSFGAEIAPEDRDLWLDEQLRLVELCGELSAKAHSVPIELAIVDALGWHAELSPWPQVCDAARGVLDGIDEDLDLLVSGAIREPWSLDWLPSRTERFGAASRGRDELAILHTRIATDLIKRFDDSAEGLDFIEARIAELETAEEKTELGSLLWAMGELKPDFLVQIGSIAIENPKLRIGRWLGPLVAAIRLRDPELARDICLRALDGGDAILAEGVARSYWSAAWVADRTDRDIEILERVLHTDKPWTRAIALHGVAALAEDDSCAAAALAAEVMVGDSTSIAEALCGAFDPEMGISTDVVSDAQLESILRQLVEVKSIEEHVIVSFLNYAGGRVPEAVVELLLTRIDRCAATEDHSYQPLPYEPFAGDLVSGAEEEELARLIRRVRDVKLGEKAETFWLARLFRIVSRRFAPAGVEALVELAQLGSDAELERAVALTECAPTSFVFAHREFVDLVLGGLKGKDDDFTQRILYLLSRSAADEWRVGPVGEPFSQNLELRDRATQARDDSPPGSLAHNFFESMVHRAERQIKHQIEIDDDF
jgi:urease gamma subunit